MPLWAIVNKPNDVIKALKLYNSDVFEAFKLLVKDVEVARATELEGTGY